MRYALNLDNDCRILSATFEKYASEGMPGVDELPGGNVADYRYVDGEYIYDPVLEPVVEYKPTADDVLNALLGVTE